MAAFASPFRLALALGLAAWLAWPAAAGAQDLADLQRQIADLEQRLTVLEEAGEVEVESVGTELQAPVTVVGEGGKVLLAIDENQGQPRLILGVESAIQLQVLAGESGTLSLARANGEGFVVTLDGEGPAVVLGGGGAQARLAQVGDAVTLDLGGAGNPQVSLSSVGGDTGLLTLGQSGGQQVVLTLSGAEGSLVMGAVGAPAVRLLTREDGNYLELGTGDDAKVQMGTPSADGAVVLVQSGEKRSYLAASTERTGLVADTPEGLVEVGLSGADWGFLLNGEGAPLALLGREAGQALALTLYEGGSLAALLEAQEGGGLYLGGTGLEAPVRLLSKGSGGELTIAGTNEAHIELISTGSDATIAARLGDEGTWLEASGTRTGGYVLTSAGLASMGQAGTEWGFTLHEGDQLAAGLSTHEGRPLGLRLFSGSTQMAAVGMVPGGTGGAIRTYAADGTTTTALGASGGGGILQIYRNDGTIAVGAYAGETLLGVFNASNAPIATLSVSSSGVGGNVTARDDSGNGVFSAGAVPAGGGEACVGRPNGKLYCLGIGLP